ncbi:MAG TPA: hypothetical protein ACFYEM_10375 [Candidatus Hypogeohydataceae bacterium YC40]
MLGDGKPGYKDGKEPRFYEPGGLAFTGGKLYIADSNNHTIRIFETNEVNTLELKMGVALATLKPPEQKPTVGLLFPGAKEITLPPQTLSANSSGELVINLNFPEGYHLSPLAPFMYSIDSKRSLTFEKEGEIVRLEGPGIPVRIPFKTLEATEFPLKVSITFYYCREDNQGVCLAYSVVWHVPIKLAAQGETALRLDYTARSPL